MCYKSYYRGYRDKDLGSFIKEFGYRYYIIKGSQKFIRKGNYSLEK